MLMAATAAAAAPIQPHFDMLCRRASMAFYPENLNGIQHKGGTAFMLPPPFRNFCCVYVLRILPCAG
ncbi:MAG: hypothetical protein Kow00124_06960 [Anaerolineae bacterium]